MPRPAVGSFSFSSGGWSNFFGSRDATRNKTTDDAETKRNTKNCRYGYCDCLNFRDAEYTTPCAIGLAIRAAAASVVAAPFTRALTLFKHELFTAMITVVNSTARVAIFAICESKSTNHFSVACFTTPATLAIGATRETSANASAATRSPLTTPNSFLR